MGDRTFLSQTKREGEFYQYILLMELAGVLTIMVCKFSRMNGTVLRFPRGREHCAHEIWERFDTKQIP